MLVRHERPASELTYRVRAPLRIVLQDGEELLIAEWCLAGILLPEAVDIPPIFCDLIIPFQGVDIRFAVKFKQGSVPRELLFVELTGRQRETLALFYRSILSGRMASSDEVIMALDTPVDLVPMGETEEEKEEGAAKAQPRALRAILSLALYAFLALAVATLLGSHIWGKLRVIPLTGSYVSAEPGSVTGWLPEPQAERAFAGMPARVRFTVDGQRRMLDGTVLTVQTGRHPLAPDKLGGVVSVHPSGALDGLSALAPVRVELLRDPLAPLARWLANARP